MPLSIEVTDTLELVAKPQSAALCGSCRHATVADCSRAIGIPVTERVPMRLPPRASNFFSDTAMRGVATATELAELLGVGTKEVLRYAKDRASLRRIGNVVVFDAKDASEVAQHFALPRSPALVSARPHPKQPVAAAAAAVPDEYVLHSIDEIDFTLHTHHFLHEHGIRELGALVSLSEQDLLKRKVRVKPLCEIKEILAAMGLKLGMSLTAAQAITLNSASAGGVPSGQDGAARPPANPEPGE